MVKGWILGKKKRNQYYVDFDLAPDPWAPFDLPASYYVAVERLEKSIAAIVLIAPERAPSRATLPRDLLDSDSDLRAVLAISAYCRTPESICAEALKKLDRSRVVNLLELAGSNSVFAYRVDWYCHQLEQLVRARSRFERALSKVGEVYESARDIATFVG